MVAGGIVGKGVDPIAGIQGACGVGKQCKNTGRSIVATTGIANQCHNTDGCIEIARGIVKERLKTDCCVFRPGGDVKQSLRAFSGIEIRIASIWRRGRQDCLRAGRKPKADEHQRDEKYWSSFF